MTYRPILFNTPMVCAVEDGRKTQTRRLISVPEPDWEILSVRPHPDLHGTRKWQAEIFGTLAGEKKQFTLGINAPCAKDDVLWVRETWLPCKWEKPRGPGLPMNWEDHGFLYYAKDEIKNSDGSPVIWRPSIHMPKEAARIFLHVDNVRAERLKSISPSDAMDEGFTDWNDFVRLWDSTVPKQKIRKCGWAANPWVWVILFTRTVKPEGWPNVRE